MRIVDLRSDTVTMPALKMRQAMKDAEKKCWEAA